MNVLDHNIPRDQAQQLRRWNLHVEQVGYEIGRPEWEDQQEILRYLHRAKQPTFLTRDIGFFRQRLCHLGYCVVVLVCPVQETAHFARRFLRHPLFKTKASRMGRVARVSPASIAWWQVGDARRRHAAWIS